MKNFWPTDLTPRPGQVEAAQALLQALKEGHRAVLDAPTGWGKTLVTLVALREAKTIPVLWLIRSLAVGERIAEDAEKIGFRSFIAGGKSKTCLIKELKKGDMYYYCRFFRYSCEYLKNLIKRSSIPLVKSYRELVRYCKERKICPYYAQDFVIKETDIIVQNYFRRRFWTEALVIDEAHNLLLPRESRFPIDQLNDIIVALEKFPYSNKKTVSSLISLKHFIEKYEGSFDSRVFIDENVLIDLESALAFFLERKIKTGIGQLLRVLKSNILYVERKTLIGIKASTISVPRPAVLLSGTFTPELSKVLDVDIYIKIERKPIQTFVLTWLTSKYNEFDDHIREYKKLLNILKKHGRVVAFGTHRVISQFRREASIYEEDIARIPANWNGILLLKTRGRFSEGVDIKAKIVTILGAPYMTPEIINRLSDIYKRLGFKDYKMLASDVPMLITTLQCIGRITRDIQTKPVVILADYRYQYFERFLSPYLNLIYLKDLDELRKRLDLGVKAISSDAMNK
ncbi:MAG: hypothetical protein DRJ44_00305 [Thermoprotei archaeon]|nr:MAG: hypothetical protein DRJ44_00305 [Thermoprotei archaeon]